MLKEKIYLKMIDFCKGNIHDIEHFMRVHAFAELIAGLENLDEKTREILEISAIVHDIACPLCREKYGNADGANQEKESPALLRDFLAEFSLPNETKERIIYIVSHHHTYSNVDGLDYQILLEADFLVNAADTENYRNAVNEFRKNVFKTSSGIKILDSVYIDNDLPKTESL